MNATTIARLTRENGWAPLRAHLGARAFGINAYTKNAGEQVVGEHKEEASGHEELYLVIAGRAKFIVDGEERDAPVGTAVLVPSGTTRAADALADGTTILVVGGRPGGVFQPRAWETNAVIFPMFGEGKIEEAREILRGAVGRYEDGESIEYNLGAARPGSATSTWRSGTSSARSSAARISSSSPVATTTSLRCGTMPATKHWSVRLRRRPAEPDARPPDALRLGAGGCVECLQHAGDLAELLGLSASSQHGFRGFTGRTVNPSLGLRVPRKGRDTLGR